MGDSRRAFLTAIGAATLRAWFQRSTAPAIQFGYAAITWNGDDAQAIDDIAAVGFRGIQLRTSAVAAWRHRPAALRDLLASRRLTFVALSSGNVRLDPTAGRDDIDTHVRHAAFVRDAGGLFLQVIDGRPQGREIVADDYTRMGRLLTDLGKRTADIGVPLVYHHHLNSLGEKPDEVRRILDAADRRHVGLLFDTAHYRQGGGDPVRAIEDYREWVRALHFKDVESPAPNANYRFVELGRGQVDFTGVFGALRRIDFKGWAVVELDRVPDAARTPKESAAINRAFLESHGFRL